MKWKPRHDWDCERVVSNATMRCNCGAARDRRLVLGLAMEVNTALLAMPPSPVRTDLHNALHALRVAYPKMPRLGRVLSTREEQPQK